jgi:hypothetical protein
MNEMPNSTRYTLDAVAGVVAVASWADLLPKIAAALSILWLLIQLGEWAWKKAKLLRGRR